MYAHKQASDIYSNTVYNMSASGYFVPGFYSVSFRELLKWPEVRKQGDRLSRLSLGAVDSS